MKFGDALLDWRAYLAASLALHAVLGAALYWFGPYRVEQRRQDTQVAVSVQATHHARIARRIEDLQTIKELMAQSATREPEAEAPMAAPPAVPDDPREQLAQARLLSQAIDGISRDIRAEELARLTGMSKEQARAEVEAKKAASTPAPPKSADPADEIAGLEEQARDLLAQRALDLRRKQEGVPVGAGEHGEAPASPTPAGGGQAARKIDDFLARASTLRVRRASAAPWGA